MSADQMNRVLVSAAFLPQLSYRVPFAIDPLLLRTDGGLAMVEAGKPADMPKARPSFAVALGYISLRELSLLVW
jgi:hypothetical protein